MTLRVFSALFLLSTSLTSAVFGMKEESHEKLSILTPQRLSTMSLEELLQQDKKALIDLKVESHLNLAKPYVEAFGELRAQAIYLKESWGTSSIPTTNQEEEINILKQCQETFQQSHPFQQFGNLIDKTILQNPSFGSLPFDDFLKQEAKTSQEEVRALTER